ncbi:MAG: hypothetical protein WCF65_06045 [Parachlamydiaceae bacterium]
MMQAETGAIQSEFGVLGRAAVAPTEESECEPGESPDLANSGWPEDEDVLCFGTQFCDIIGRKILANIPKLESKSSVFDLNNCKWNPFCPSDLDGNSIAKGTDGRGNPFIVLAIKITDVAQKIIMHSVLTIYQPNLFNQKYVSFLKNATATGEHCELLFREDERAQEDLSKLEDTVDIYPHNPKGDRIFVSKITWDLVKKLLQPDCGLHTSVLWDHNLCTIHRELPTSVSDASGPTS